MSWMQLLDRIGPATEKLKSKGIDFSLWYKPENYRTALWAAQDSSFPGKPNLSIFTSGVNFRGTMMVIMIV